ncbi:hypothetical protein EDD18DRAFT_1352780 [Armillaria luteobubalina]|uniref:Uncharacterized protein n=1 Tax=Armillaria luteobubalina TaxID=153913 RepID=A0AA39Q7T6_9AGAR|nr:hypothetical protein EDD18DRAFT_1352780 [Armillaria luteobubalina]
MAPPFDTICPIDKALPMHTAAWQSEEEGFMEDKAWFGLADQLWLLLVSLDVNLVGNSYEEFEYLAVEAEKMGFNVPLLLDPEDVNTSSLANPGASNSLVLPPVLMGDEPIPHSPTPMVSTAGKLPLFPLPPSHEPHGDSPPSRSKFELEDHFWEKYGLQKLPSANSLCKRVHALSLEVEFPSSPKCCHLDKDKKGKKNKESKKAKEMEPESMTAIVFPPKPPVLSELVACLEHLQALTLPKSVTEAAKSFWFCKAKDLETLIFIHYTDYLRVKNIFGSDVIYFNSANVLPKWPDIDAIYAMAQPVLGAIDGLI